MTEETYALIRIETREASAMGAGEAAFRCGVHPGLIDRFVRLGLCEPAGWDEDRREWVFDPGIVPLVRKILRLREELGVNYQGVGVILELLSRIERLEGRLRIVEWSRSDRAQRAAPAAAPWERSR